MVVVGPTHNYSEYYFDKYIFIFAVSVGPSVFISTVVRIIHDMQEFELKRQYSYYLASCSYGT